MLPMFGHKRHFALARERIAEMGKAVTALERMVRKAPAGSETKRLLSEMKKRRAQLQATADQMKAQIDRAQMRLKKLSGAAVVSWSAYSAALAKARKALARANHKTAKRIKRAVR